MSEKALIDSIEVQLKMLRAEGYERVILTPGNIGRDFLRAHLSGESLEIREMRQEEMEVSVPTVSISNFIGDALDLSRDLGFQEVLLVGHAGKLVKLAGGVMNTHSRCADGRQEFITAHAALLGADRNCLMGLMRAVTVDACLDLLEEAGILREVEVSLTRAVQEHLTRRAEGAISVGAVLFTSAHGIFGITEEAEKMLPHFGFSGAGGAEGWSISSERVRETRNLSQ
jgi:cobalt-precorrin-5B (C1)-methyltransferase